MKQLSFSCSVVSDSLRPHGLQHAGPSCPSLSPRVFWNSCPLSQWCHPTISSFVSPFSSYPPSFPASVAFRLVITFLPRNKCLFISWLQSPSSVILEPKKIKSDTVSTVYPSICHEVMGPDDMKWQMSWLFASGGQSSGVSALASVLPMNIQDWFPLGFTGWISLQSKGLSRVFSNTTIQKHQFFGAFFMVQLSHLYMTTGKTVALTIWTFLSKVIALLFNTLSTFVTTSCEDLTHWKRPWCWEGLGAGGEGDNRGWDGWMASLTQWTWVWVNSGNWWWRGRPGVLQFMGSQRVGHDWATELNRTSIVDYKNTDVTGRAKWHVDKNTHPKGSKHWYKKILCVLF